MTKLKNSNCDKTQKVKLWHNLKISKCLSKNNLTPPQPMRFLRAAFRDLGMFPGKRQFSPWPPDCQESRHYQAPWWTFLKKFTANMEIEPFLTKSQQIWRMKICQQIYGKYDVNISVLYLAKKIINLWTIDKMYCPYKRRKTNEPQDNVKLWYK